jgi:hypothetical protein
LPESIATSAEVPLITGLPITSPAAACRHRRRKAKSSAKTSLEKTDKNNKQRKQNFIHFTRLSYAPKKIKKNQAVDKPVTY